MLYLYLFYFLPFLCLSRVLTKCWFYLQVCLEVFESNELYVPFLVECQSLQGDWGESWGREEKRWIVFSVVFFWFVCFSLPSLDGRPPTSGIKAGPKCRLSRRPDQEAIEDTRWQDAREGWAKCRLDSGNVIWKNMYWLWQYFFSLCFTKHLFKEFLIGIFSPLIN